MEHKLGQILKESQIMHQQTQTRESSSVHAKLQQLKHEYPDKTDQDLRQLIKKQELKENQSEERVLSFENLRNALMDFGVTIRRPPFLEDKQQSKYTAENVRLNRKEQNFEDEKIDTREALILTTIMDQQNQEKKEQDLKEIDQLQGEEHV